MAGSRRRGAALLAFALLTGADATRSCEPLQGARRAETERYVVTYRAVPAPLVPARHFALDIGVCPKAGKPAGSLRIDAIMPEHGHGMAYSPSVKPLGGGRFRAEGLMFHMPGRWRLVFDLGDDRAVDELHLQ